MELMKREVPMMGYTMHADFVLDLSTNSKSEPVRNVSPHVHHASPHHSPSPPCFPSPVRESSPHVDTTTFHSTSPVMRRHHDEINCLPHRSPTYEHQSGKMSPVCEADSGYSLSPRSYKGESDGSMSPPPTSLVQSVLDTQHATRPFKAYPRNPLALGHDEAFLQFREQMLSKVRSLNRSSNPSKARLQNNCGDDKDAAYWERRRKNNAAAKRSRDARRAKEDEIAIRAAFLEQENLRLKYEIASLKDETCKLRSIVYSNNPSELLHVPQVHALHPINHLQRI